MISNGGLIPRRHALSRYLGVLGGTVITAAAVALAGGVPVLAAAATAPAAGSGGWSGPRQLPGPRGITERGIFFSALSCTSRSDCTAVGFFLRRPPGRALETGDFAVTERRGVWGRAVIIAAPAAKNVSFGGLSVLSCASAGNCAAGDSYTASGQQQGGFVVSEANGTWGKARKVPSVPSAISCPAPGDCTAALAGGYLLSEVRGTWRTPFPVPGLAALNHDTSADTVVISCPSPGSCAAAGAYFPGNRSFVVTQRHGIWGKAQPVRGGPGAGLVITALSCPSAGSCVAAGDAFRLGARGFGSFAVTEAHGRWGTATVLPGTFRLRYGISLLDCPAAGACIAVGEGSPRQDSQTFVSTEKNGTWHSAQTIPGLFPPNIDSLSCDAAGSCVLAGSQGGRSGDQAASAALVNGRWGAARVLRGVRAVARGRDSEIDAVSCPARSRCTAVGTFLVPHFAGPLFAVVQR